MLRALTIFTLLILTAFPSFACKLELVSVSKTPTLKTFVPKPNALQLELSRLEVPEGVHILGSIGFESHPSVYILVNAENYHLIHELNGGSRYGQFQDRDQTRELRLNFIEAVKFSAHNPNIIGQILKVQNSEHKVRAVFHMKTDHLRKPVTEAGSDFVLELARYGIVAEPISTRETMLIGSEVSIGNVLKASLSDQIASIELHPLGKTSKD